MKLSTKDRLIISAHTKELVNDVEKRFAKSYCKKIKKNLGYYIDNHTSAVCMTMFLSFFAIVTIVF